MGLQKFGDSRSAETAAAEKKIASNAEPEERDVASERAAQRRLSALDEENDEADR